MPEKCWIYLPILILKHGIVLVLNDKIAVYQRFGDFFEAELRRKRSLTINKPVQAKLYEQRCRENSYWSKYFSFIKIALILYDPKKENPWIKAHSLIIFRYSSCLA